MSSRKTWVIVADGSVARLFDMPGRAASLTPHEHHLWTAPPPEEFADEQGVGKSRMGRSMHRMARHTGPDHDQLIFAREIAGKLAQAHQAGRFDDLVIAAPPKMLGLLRDQLDEAVQRSVRLEIDKDLTNMPLEDIGAVLSTHMGQ